MANEINGVPTPHLKNTSQNDTIKSININSGQKKQSQTNNLAGNADKVSMTDSATKLQALEQHIATMPVVDEQRVASIRAAIQKGDFAIDPTSTASKLLSLESALLRS